MAYLVADIRSIVDGDAWHGPSWRVVLDGVDAERATRRILPPAHTIYELVHHTAAWAGEVARRLRGHEPSMPAEGDFPTTTSRVSDEEWRRVVARLNDAHQELIAVIEQFDETGLDERIGTSRDAPLGSGVTYRTMIAGLLAHTAYHAGQAMMLRRATEQDQPR